MLKSRSSLVALPVAVGWTGGLRGRLEGRLVVDQAGHSGAGDCVACLEAAIEGCSACRGCRARSRARIGVLQ